LQLTHIELTLDDFNSPQQTLKSKMRNINLTISNVTTTNAGDIAIVTNSCKENAKGSWVLTPKQATRLLASAGLTLATKHELVGGTLTVNGQDVKAGDTWTNEQSGETGFYEKDHFRNQISDMSIALTAQASMRVSVSKEIANQMAAMFGFGVQAPAQSLSSIPATAIVADVRIGESITAEAEEAATTEEAAITTEETATA
jgi:hypothetical protein